MPAKTLADTHSPDIPALAEAIAGVPAPQVARCDADVIQVDGSSLSGNPEEREWTTAVHTVLDAVPSARRASLLRQLRRAGSG